MRTLTKEKQDRITPSFALNLLREGNERFTNNLKFNRNLLQQVNDTKDGQHPIAVILSCIDSRTSAELIFDQGLGDVFSVRIAGNVLNKDILGSMEFACKLAGAKIVVVLGHTRCGAVKGACEHVKLGHLSGLLSKLNPAVERTPRPASLNGNIYEYVDAVAVSNVHYVIDQIAEESDILREMVDAGQIAIVGGMYDVETGRVEFFEHPDLCHFENDETAKLELDEVLL
jgi:carbonic anhydrase